MRRARAVVLLLGVITAAACARPALRPPGLVTDPGRRFSGRGFSVGPPVGDQWYVLRQDPAIVGFAKDLGGRGLHTVMVFVAAADSPTPIATPEDLRAFVQETTRKDFDNPRFTAVASNVEAEAIAGASCVRMRFTAEDRGVAYAMASVFILRGWQMVCVHPGSAGRGLVLVGASQRYLITGRPAEIDGEVEAVLRTLRFEPLG